MKKLLSILMLLVAIVTGAKADDTQTIKAGTVSSGAFTYSGLTEYTYTGTGYWTNGENDVIQIEKGSFTFTNNQGVTITGITVNGVNEANTDTKSATITVSDGTHTATTGSVSWVGRRSTSPSSHAMTGVSSLNMDANTQYTVSVAAAEKNMKITLDITYIASTKVATPTATIGDFNLKTLKYPVTLSCATSGATIKYTVNSGSEQTSTKDVTLNLNPGDILNASAVKEGLDNSDAMAPYTVPEAPEYHTVTFTPGSGTGETFSINVLPNAKINLPKSFTMYHEGETMSGWTKDNTPFDINDEYTVTENATFNAKYDDNYGTTLAGRTVATELVFDFQQKNGAPSVTWQAPTEPTSGVWVTQANVAGKSIDVKMDWDVTTIGAKINNSAWSDWSQLNDGTKFIIPSAEGATVDIEAYNDTDDATTVNDAVRTSVNGNISHYEISSDAATATIIMSGKASYYRTIKVTLPGPKYTVTNTLTGITKTAGEETVEGGTEYTATYEAADNYGLPETIEVTAGGADISANCTWASGTLTIPAAYTTGDIAINIEGVVIAGSVIIKAQPDATNHAVVTGTIGGTAEVSLQDGGETGGYKFGGANHRLAVTLASGCTFKEGDVINIHLTKAADNNSFLQIYDGTGSTKSVVYEQQTQGVVGDNFFTLPAAAEGKTTLAIIRTNADNDHKWNAYVDYIEVSRPNETITTNNGVATYVTKNALDFTGLETKAYVVTGVNAGKTKVLTQEVTTVPANTALLIKGNTVDVPVIEDADAPATNLFQISDGSVVQNAQKTIFVYSKTAKAFKRLGTATIPDGKCYITIEGVPEATQSLDVDIEGEATAITNVNANENVNAEAPVKIIKNGKLYIGNYNVAGQQVK